MDENPAKLTMTEFGLAAVIESTENDAEKTITVSVPISARNMNDELEMGMDDNMLVKTGQNDILIDDEVRKESGNSKAIIFGDKLVCPYCLRKFQRFRERDNHVKMIHEKSSVGKFSCKQCEKSYMSESALNYHVDIVHASGGKDFKCKHCEKSFKHKMLLERHMKLHKKNSYHCQLCEKTFSLKYYLTQHNKKAHHLVDHDVDKAKYLKEADSDTFKCKICNKMFWGEDADRNLADHLVSKCKENELFTCNNCHKKFTTKYNLEKHLNVFHTSKQEVFVCENCSYTTKHKSNLNRHVRKAHTDTNK